MSTDKQTDKKPLKDVRGRFIKGNPGGGRPKGSPDRRTARYREALESELPDLLETLVGNARNGDMTAMKMILDRVLPPLKPAEQAKPFPVDGDSMIDVANGILKNASAGAISIADAVALLNALATFGRVTDAARKVRREEESKQWDSLLG